MTLKNQTLCILCTLSINKHQLESTWVPEVAFQIWTLLQLKGNFIEDKHLKTVGGFGWKQGTKVLWELHSLEYVSFPETLVVMLHPSPSVKTVLASSGWKPRHECYKVQKPASSNTDLATNTKCWIMMCRWLEEKALKERGSMEIITDNYEVKKSMRRFLLINIQATYHNSSLNEDPWYSTKCIERLPICPVHVPFRWNPRLKNCRRSGILGIVVSCNAH
jgi:hypothetical protein